MTELDIEQPGVLIDYLRRKQLIAPAENPAITVLAGGVSNRTVLVERASGEAWVVKQALAKLRVEVDWFSSPERIHREADGLRWLAELAPVGSITPLVFEDREQHILGMAAVPQPHQNWKALLLRCEIEPEHVRQFARLIGQVHRLSHDRLDELMPVFGERDFYETLRIEPYYRYTASQVPAAAHFFDRLIADTYARRDTIVHGDFSPKNVLVQDGRLVLLDHEVIHLGDPCFDLGFGLTHLLSKAHHLSEHRQAFAKAAVQFWCDYWAEITTQGEPSWAADLQERAVRHTLGCMLARVRGRSPLEYLDEAERNMQADIVCVMMGAPPKTVARLVETFTRWIDIQLGNHDYGRIAQLHAVEILDSRGRPTIQTSCELADGTRATVSIPSGASTGSAEAHELRDGDPARYGGLGVRKAVANVNGEINQAVVLSALTIGQTELDQSLIELDGTPKKSRLGANAILSVSLAAARTAAMRSGVPLYDHFATAVGTGDAPRQLPRPTVNLFSGGKHAGGQIPIQDVLITSLSATTAAEAMEQIVAVFNAAASLCCEKYGMRMLVADEGGLAPDFPSVDAALSDAVTAIERAGLQPDVDMALCVDVAASHFFADGRYHIDGRDLTSREMIDVIESWLDRYPIVSVEDGLHEDDWEEWPLLVERIGGRALVLGDDLLTTNPARIARAVETTSATALLLKVNQIGTLTEAAEALRLAREAGMAIVVSARSGETEDDWLTDLAVGWGGDQMKVGSVTRSERLAKWNRLLTIADETGWPLASWPAPSHT